MKQIFEYVQSVVIIALVLAGIGGLSWRTFKQEGWLGSLLDRTWDAIVDHPMVTIPVLIAIFVIGKLWHDHQVEKGHTSKLPNLFLYGVMAAGVYFIWQLVSTGSF